MIRIALVDDHAVLREALAFMLGREPDLTIVAQASTLAEARSFVETTSIDVVLVDLELPDGDGLDLLPSIRHHIPDSAALVLSGNARPESQALAVAAGAVGFLAKATPVSELTVAIRRVAAGDTLFTQHETVALVHEAMRYHAQTRARQRALASLTSREREVLQGLAAGLDNKALAEQLHVGSETIRTHVVRILRKLGVHSRLQAAVLALRHGLVDSDPPP